jgi:hypothetical protein
MTHVLAVTGVPAKTPRTTLTTTVEMRMPAASAARLAIGAESRRPGASVGAVEAFERFLFPNLGMHGYTPARRSATST